MQCRDVIVCGGCGSLVADVGQDFDSCPSCGNSGEDLFMSTELVVRCFGVGIHE
jgi:rRNA maturation endonuclease Nob1